MRQITEALEQILISGDPESLRTVLHPQVRWGDCLGPQAVLQTIRAMLTQGATVTAVDFSEHGDRILANITADMGHGPFEHVIAVLVEDGKVTHLIDTDTDQALTLAPPDGAGSLQGSPTQLTSMAAIFPCRNVPAALAHYTALGFATSSYDDGYGYAERDGVALHFSAVDDLDPATTTSAVYLFVDDADDLHAEWINAGVSGRFRAPEDTPYGLREGAHIDLDGNLMRYGSRIAGS